MIGDGGMLDSPIILRAMSGRSDLGQRGPIPRTYSFLQRGYMVTKNVRRDCSRAPKLPPGLGPLARRGG